MVGGGSTLSAFIQAATYYRENSSPCTITFKSDGTVWVNEGTNTYRYTWKTGSGTGSDYEIRVTPTGGSPGGFSSGSTGTWLSLSSNRAWTRGSSTSGGLLTVIATYEIRDATSLVVLASASITLENQYIDYGGPLP